MAGVIKKFGAWLPIFVNWLYETLIFLKLEKSQYDIFVPNTFHTFHPHGNRLFLVNRNYRKKQFQFTTYIYEYIYIDKYLDCSKEINTLTSFIV